MHVCSLWFVSKQRVTSDFLKFYFCHYYSYNLGIGVHSSRGLGGGGGKIVGRVEPEHPLDEGTEWVVGCSTETVDSSPSTESMDSWAAAPWTESVDFSLS